MMRNTTRKVSKHRLNKMLKYFKNKKVKISYKWRNSIGGEGIREYNGIYDSFEIEQLDYTLQDACFFRIKMFKKGKWVFEEEFEYYAIFTGLGKIQQTSGPTNYFSITLI